MGYIENKEAELHAYREAWVKNRIHELKSARTQIDTQLAARGTDPQLRYSGHPVGYIDEIAEELRIWYHAEPSEHGEVFLSVAHDDRNSMDFIFVRVV